MSIDHESLKHPLQFLVATPSSSKVIAVNWNESKLPSYDDLLNRILEGCRTTTNGGVVDSSGNKRRYCLSRDIYLVGPSGRILDAASFPLSLSPPTVTPPADSSTRYQTRLYYVQLKVRIRGGMDRQNRVGSKFGGGGVSSSQNAERERKDRLKRLALESIDLAKDPYLVRNHLGSYECKLCLTLHRDEANYLAHTQGKKHQQGLARRAHLDLLKAEREGTTALPMVSSTTTSAPSRAKVRIGRPAYQVFKSRDADTNQRCLSFELHYPELQEDWQPRHRFMSAFEQRVESPPDRRYQYLLFAAGEYETVAFRIPNEPIDKGQDRFVTNWDGEGKKFTLTLFFVNGSE
jgi:splicing factor 3A subunit 2